MWRKVQDFKENAHGLMLPITQHHQQTIDVPVPNVSMKGKVRSSGEGERHNIKGLITKDLAFSHAVGIWLNNDKTAMSMM